MVRMTKAVVETLTDDAHLLGLDYRRFRTLFDETVRGAGLPGMAWKPYSLRRGGATDDFGHHASFDKTTQRGRWQSSRTARIYINEAMAEVGNMVTTPKQLRLQEQFQKYVPFA